MKITFTIGEPFNKTFSMPVNVTSLGVFTCTLPADIAALFAGRIELSHYRRDSAPGYFQSDTYAGLCHAVKYACDALCSERLIEKRRVIRFAIETTCSYAFDGVNVWPNAVTGPTEPRWKNGNIPVHAASPAPFGFKIYAQVCDKHVYEYEATGATRVDYLRVPPDSSHEQVSPDDYFNWINSLAGLSSHNMKLQEVDFSPETGKFFVDMFKSLFALNERLLPFLNPDGITYLAAQQKNLLTETT